MNVVEGLKRVQKFFPGAMFQMNGNDHLEATHLALHQVADGPEPVNLRELIRASLGIRGNIIVLMS